ncbi:Hpt domain-containing protein [Peteryoungia ipomoeae]|uniref:Hpt domain-containing protein n=1 Tax=Peteryoungia ipomoeae TaxID=1210932 RepID=A0A4V4HN71_9HYPH|nr:Hpt domain-containing protein [Peteryoungia ipomoeae]THV24966.1 Hpt domain-containing protein [Peteryoungia ipomoeae]
MINTSSIAFEAPQLLEVASRRGSRPIDLQIVNSAVDGDKLREIQLLEGFARKARKCLRVLGEGATGAEVKKVVTGLRNAALSIGAMRVVGALEILEMKGNTTDALASVAASVLEAELFILKIAR